MKTHADMVRNKAWQKCEAGHKSHDIITVPTDLGDMFIYDFEKYMGFDGYCSGQDDISKTLKLYGRWEVEETALVRKVLETGNRNAKIIDIGAHIGWFSKLAQSMGYKYIYGFEADDENIELYKNNTAHECWITSIWFDENASLKDEQGLNDNGRIELLKIDIEGAERHAISAVRHLLPNVDNILIEVSPVFNDSYPELIDSLRADGFKVFNMDGTPFNFQYDFDQTNLWLTRHDV